MDAWRGAPNALRLTPATFALGTAVIAAVLTISVNTRVPTLRGGGLGAMLHLENTDRARIEHTLTHAVGATYAPVVALMLIALAAAALALHGTSSRTPLNHPGSQ